MPDPVLILGCGFLGQTLAQRLTFAGVPVVGSARADAQLQIIRTRGATPLKLDGEASVGALRRQPLRFGRVLMAIPPSANLDARLAGLVGEWELGPGRVVYVSSTSVYGDREAADTDEDTPPAPATDKARMRLAAEAIWQRIGASVVRPAGIYGPGRSLLHRIAAGRHRLIDGGRAIVNRIHVSDLARICEAAMNAGRQRIHLGCDLAPTTQAEVVQWVTTELGLPAPPAISLAEARVRLSKDVLAMFTQPKRLRPQKTLDNLAIKLRFPSYREGLADIWAREKLSLEEMARRTTT